MWTSNNHKKNKTNKQRKNKHNKFLKEEQQFWSRNGALDEVKSDCQ